MEYIYNCEEHCCSNDETSKQYATDVITLIGIVTSSMPIRCKNGLFLYTVKIPRTSSSDDVNISALLKAGYSISHQYLFFILTDKIIRRNSIIQIENGRYIVSDIAELVNIEKTFIIRKFYKCNKCNSISDMTVRIYTIYANSIHIIQNPNQNCHQFQPIPVSLYEKRIHISSCHSVFRSGGRHAEINGTRPTYAYIVNASDKFRIMLSSQCQIPKNTDKQSLVDLYGSIIILNKKLHATCPVCGNTYKITVFKPVFIIDTII